MFTNPAVDHGLESGPALGAPGKVLNVRCSLVRSRHFRSKECYLFAFQLLFSQSAEIRGRAVTAPAPKPAKGTSGYFISQVSGVFVDPYGKPNPPFSFVY